MADRCHHFIIYLLISRWDKIHKIYLTVHNYIKISNCSQLYKDIEFMSCYKWKQTKQIIQQYTYLYHSLKKILTQLTTLLFHFTIKTRSWYYYPKQFILAGAFHYAFVLMLIILSTLFITTSHPLN